MTELNALTREMYDALSLSIREANSAPLSTLSALWVLASLHRGK